jgi:hypothetical protein
MVLDTTQMALYLGLVLTVAAVSVALSLAVIVRAVAVNRGTRLAHHESMRTYYGRLAFHH